MIYSYEFTKLAINDIDKTLNYITNNLCNKNEHQVKIKCFGVFIFMKMFAITYSL